MSQEIRLKLVLDGGKEVNASLDLTQDNLKQLVGGVNQAKESGRDFGSSLVHNFTSFRNVLQAVKEGIDLARTSIEQPIKAFAELEELRESFQGTTKDIELFKKAVAGTVTEANLIKLSNQATDLGLSLEQQTILFSVAENAGDKYGGNVESNFQRIVAASEGASKGLRSLGIQKEVYETIIKKLASAHGATIDKLDAETQKQIRLQAIIEASGVTIADVTNKVENNADKIAQLTVMQEEFQAQTGELLLMSLKPFLETFNSLNKTIDNTIPSAKGAIGFIATLTAGFITLRTTGILPALGSIKLFNTALLSMRGLLITSGIGAVLVILGVGINKIAELTEKIKAYNQATSDVSPFIGVGKTQEEIKFIISDAENQIKILEIRKKQLEKMIASPFTSGVQKSDYEELEKTNQQLKFFTASLSANREQLALINETKIKQVEITKDLLAEQMKIFNLNQLENFSEKLTPKKFDLDLESNVPKSLDPQKMDELIKIRDEQLRGMADNEFNLMRANANIEYEQKVSEYGNLERLRQQHNEALREIDNLERNVYLSAVANTLSQASQLFAEHTAAFKLMAIASAMISTYQAAISVYESSAKIPFVGFLLAPVNAALALAFGMKQVAAISGVQIKGFERGGRLAKGQAGFFEGYENEIVAPEKTFIEIFKNELRPQIYNQPTNNFSSGAIEKKLDQVITAFKEKQFEINLNELRTVNRRLDDIELKVSY